MPGENPDKLNDETPVCMQPVVRETWHLCAPVRVINVSMCKLSVCGFKRLCFHARLPPLKSREFEMFLRYVVFYKVVQNVYSVGLNELYMYV